MEMRWLKNWRGGYDIGETNKMRKPPVPPRERGENHNLYTVNDKYCSHQVHMLFIHFLIII